MANELNKINEELSLEMNVAYIDGDDIVDDFSTLQDQGEEFIHLDKHVPISLLEHAYQDE